MGQTNMIAEERGNLLDADVDALVNTVNTVGVMGKGIALQFRRAYPDMRWSTVPPTPDAGVSTSHTSWDTTS